MNVVLKKVLSRFRQVCESCIFVILFPLFLMLWIVISSVTFLRCFLSNRSDAAKAMKKLIYSSWNRWKIFFCSGLSTHRRVWWPAFSFEAPFNIWRYVLMFEIVELWNLNACCDVRPESSITDNVLVVKLGHYGDTLHIIPMLRSLKRQVENASITLLIGPWNLNIAEKIPYIDDYWVYAPRWCVFNRNGTTSFNMINELSFLWKLRSCRFTLLISTSTMSFIDYFIVHAVNAVHWVGVDPETELYGASGESYCVPYDSSCYEAERVSGLLQLIDLESGCSELEYILNDEAKSFACKFANERLDPSRPIIAVAPGAGWPGKIWPAKKFVLLVDCLIQKYKAQIVLIGASDEKAIAKNLVSHSEATLINMVGDTTLDEAAALISIADLFIGNDSAPLHIAAAMKCQTLSLFGPTNVGKWAPKGEGNRVLHAHADCPGCFPWHPKVRCQLNPDCIQSISVKDAFTAACELLDVKAW